MYTDKPIHFYYSIQGLVCIVPRPKMTGVKTDKAGNPVAVYYPTYPQGYRNPTGKHYPDLFGLNIEDYLRENPALVIYELGDGSLLAANSEAIAIAGRGINNACPKKTDCYIHLVKDLQKLDQQPDADLVRGNGLPSFIFY